MDREAPENFPVGQTLQATAPSTTPVPSASMLESVVKLPGWQALHWPVPVLGVNLPAGQLTQPLLLVLGWCCPTAQSMHEACPALLWKRPSTQLEQTVDALCGAT